MDFGYKVIKNRLGSLVANAIQKKIKDEVAKSSEGSAKTPLVVKAIYESAWEVNHTAQEVLQAIENDRPVQYFVKTSEGWGSGIILNNIVDPSFVRIELLVIRDYLDGELFTDKLAHIDGRIESQ